MSGSFFYFWCGNHILIPVVYTILSRKLINNPINELYQEQDASTWIKRDDTQIAIKTDG